MRAVIEVEIAAAHGGDEKHRANGEGDGAAMQQAVSARLAGHLRLLFSCLSRRFGMLGGWVVRWQGRPRLDLVCRGPLRRSRNEMRAVNFLERLFAVFQNTVPQHDCRSFRSVINETVPFRFIHDISPMTDRVNKNDTV